MKNKILSSILGIFLLVSMLNVISAVSITDVSSNPSEVVPGQTADITIEIENIFDYDIENIRVKLDLTQSPFAPYQSSSEKFLDELGSEDSEDFEFQLIALPDTLSGIYKIPVQIIYEDNTGINTTKNEMISLIVNSKPELKISLEDSVTIIKGRENKISVRIVNSGLADVKFLYVTMNEANGINILSEKEQYIGDIDSDDFDSVEYNIYINPDASNTIDTPVTIKYKDATNKEFSEVKIISIRTYSLKEAQELGLAKKPNYTLYAGIAFVVIVFIIYRIRKSIKKRKKIEGR
jgi:hypothetical protein